MPDSPSSRSFSALLPRFALRRPVTVAMALLAVAVLGAIAGTRIPLQLMPGGYEHPELWVWMPYSNSSPREVERSIVQPVEDGLETLPGLKRLSARAREGSASFELEFAQGTDMAEAYNALVDRLDRVGPELPDDLKRWFVYKYNPDDNPVLWAAVSLPDEVRDPAYIIETKVQRALERVPGVGKVEFHGAHRARLYVDFDRERLDRHKVNLYQVMQKLQADNFTMPSGRLDEGGRVVLVRSLSTFDSRDEVARLPIGGGLVLEDVAEVTLARPASTTIHRVNGRPAASIEVFKESGANTIEVTRRLREKLDELAGDPALEGFGFHRFFDQGELIGESIQNLRLATIQGGLLAVVVLFVFLRQLRVTLLIAGGIPLSLLMTLVIMYFRGDTVNILAMMGLMLSVGMVVDNSIVVVESIYRRRELGDSSTQAALRGTSEVSLAILAATSTTLVVFLPVILMSEGGPAFFLKAIGLPVCFALLSSLVVALVFVPLATTRFTGQGAAAPSRAILWITDRYEALLGLVLGRRMEVFLLATLAMATLQYPMEHVERTDELSGGVVDFAISLQFPGNFTQEEVEAALLRVEGVILPMREEWNARAVRTQRWGSSRRGRVMVFLEKRERGDPSKEEIIKAAEELIPEIAGVESWVGWRKGEGSDNTMTILLTGDDSDTLAELGEDVVRRLEAVRGVVGAEAETEEGGNDELRVRVDRDRAQRYGVSPEVLARSVSFGFRGMGLRPVTIDDKEFEMQAGFRLEDRRDADRLGAFQVSSSTRGSVALSTVADLEYGRGYGTIHRQDRKTTLRVEVSYEGEDLAGLTARMGAALKGMNLPRGYEWTPGRRLAEMEDQDAQRVFALAMSVAFVFLLMGMLFESAWLPMSVLLSIPFAFLGVYWMLFLTGTPFDVMSGIGLVILVGIVVNNAIVLVDRVQQNRAAGMERREAILDAGRERFRPIVMTALTTIVGLLPMALGDAEVVGTPYYPLGRAVIGGLVTSTLLSLLVVPLFYTLFDDLRGVLMSWFRGAPAPAATELPGA